MTEDPMGLSIINAGESVHAVGRYVVGHIEKMGGKTDEGIHLPDSTNVESVHVESIGGEVDVMNQDGMELKIGDRVLVLSIAKIPVWIPSEQTTKKLAIFDCGSIVGVIAK